MDDEKLTEALTRDLEGLEHAAERGLRRVLIVAGVLLALVATAWVTGRVLRDRAYDRR